MRVDRGGRRFGPGETWLLVGGVGGRCSATARARRITESCRTVCQAFKRSGVTGAYHPPVIRLRLSAADLRKTTFAYSPIAELTASLWMLAAGTVPPVHRAWYAEVRPRLRHLDWPVLHAVAPHRHELPIFLFPPTSSVQTSIDSQLRAVAEVPGDLVRSELEHTWNGDPMPDAAQSVIADGRAGARRIAEALWEYWAVAVEPYWARIRAVFDDDLGYRSAALVDAGMSVVLAGLDPELRIEGDTLLIDKPDEYTTNLDGAGLRLIPSVFIDSGLAYAGDAPEAPSIAYPSRRLIGVWEPESECDEVSALAALIGKSRATILLRLRLPRPTSALARELRLSQAAVNQHLTVLHRSGLLSSRRSGRLVLYQRTALADELIAAAPAELAARQAKADSAGTEWSSVAAAGA